MYGHCVYMLLYKIVKIAHKVAPHIYYNCNQIVCSTMVATTLWSNKSCDLPAAAILCIFHKTIEPRNNPKWYHD